LDLAGRAREPGQHHGGFVQHPFHGFAGGGDLGLHFAPVRFAEIADLHQRIDEEAQSRFGRQPAGRCVRRVDETELLQVRHHVAHRGGRQRRGDQARDVARAHGLAGGEVTLHDLAENVARALVELSEAHLRRADRDVLGQ
jgi:hypothetical protein